MTIHAFGIRHHGPGSARHLREALEALSPDIVLIEGPPEANELVPLVADEELVPPVAILIHAVDDPKLASFYPFAEFSPEWVALRYAVERGIPARFADLPQTHALAERKVEEPGEPGTEAETETEISEAVEELEDAPAPEDEDEGVREDPIALLAEAAGFDDPEAWWDTAVEHRRDATDLFDAVREAMATYREGRPLPLREARREAAMRNASRAAEKEGKERIAFVCGAFHAPAVATLGPAKKDAELLRGLPKVKVEATFIPWTQGRLTFRSGYGAGVDSPGWYAMVFRHGPRAPLFFATEAARLLRAEDLDASSANVIETVRLADALASMRDLPAPGLAEAREAILTVLTGGAPERAALIRTKLEVGHRLGRVPEGAPRVPLVIDFEKETTRLRMKPTSEHVQKDLDLRKEMDRDRSRLLHRLGVLGIAWGRLEATGRSASAGTFRESWKLAWEPEMSVELVAANLDGHTVAQAASARMVARAEDADLAELTSLVEVAIAAHLPSSLDAIVAALDSRAASSNDVQVHMLALGPLVRVVRYGDVRETRADVLVPLLHGLFARVVVGLAPACAQLDDAGAEAMAQALDEAEAACVLLDDAAVVEEWNEALLHLADSEPAHARLRGRACRHLLSRHLLAEGELDRRTSLALSRAVEPIVAVAFLEGLLSGSGLGLVHQAELLPAVDRFLAALDDETFQAMLPVLRRAFSSFTPAERRAAAERVKSLGGPGAKVARPAAAPTEPLHEGRVAAVLPGLAHLLGVAHA